MYSSGNITNRANSVFSLRLAVTDQSARTSDFSFRLSPSSSSIGNLFDLIFFFF